MIRPSLSAAVRLLVLVAWVLAVRPAVAGDWPQILGPARDGIAAGEEAPAPWGSDGPRIVWRRPVGAGFAGPAVAGDRVYVFDRTGDRERLTALAAATGNELWSTGHPTRYRDDFGFDEGPRAVPTVAGGRVYTFGAQGVLTATDAGSGERVWQVETHSRFGVPKGYFGAAGSPLVAGDRVLLNVGGKGGKETGIVALSATDGSTLWTATDHEASYSSGVLADLDGAPAAIFFTREGLVGLDPATGAVRFSLRHRARIQASVNAANPLVVGSRIFLSASYGTGAILVDAADVDEAGAPRRIWASDDALSSHYATSVLHDGTLYGFHGRQEYGPSLRAVELATGKVAWSEDRFGAGSILRVGDRLLVMHENGELILVATNPARFEPLARARILDGVVRALPAYANGKLYARNSRELVCVALH